ncbi:MULTISPECIES: Co2+/Mg2+ efflux protein ApaG [Idiomarina]|jgi:ApaG protein|uniref:Protein ApaG n=1 Tax=Idiomarina baltica OS145 TaxID=314276 RepID=A0ABM9WN25_9GAMM|nr:MULTISPECIES: Co2+/Mg2+ efflux protein ApaG [Idiomarina]MAF74400.1 Co2+/Mg2+ efflux protein ApaG [Idiomarinaceae bacterium]MEC8925698.1 Co2+/Mg2+ efflux protein ApaG [Pseudomonadota bacterium]EAQ32353.1 hypothetical protein OS145_07891 [Idiomarina baltica OS145]KXS36166.1 MAG: ApaG protein [Idiomarina sp. T82-3]MBL74792.1 Co2+/Mg2+ efflux protein ApaG [Idiomarinaceae bacterium]|tara:strand:+ start:2738 stop:3115 length:378 start_codon:yes stop_codon:yes gene_type:complete
MTVKTQVHIEVSTQYIAAQSNPNQGQYVFSYTIKISNNAAQDVTLKSREWRITDAEGKITRVAGEGVIGQQPTIAPGKSFSYTSGTVIATPVGMMEGHYLMFSEQGEQFKVPIPSFRLAIPNIIH